MDTKTTTIRGFAADILIIETVHQTGAGEVLWYVATIIVQNRQTGLQRVVGRTRIPGSGKTLAKAVERQGLRAVQSLAVA